MQRPLALIVDDETDLLTLMRLTLMRMGIDCELAANLKEAYACLQKHSFDLCLTDLNLPDGRGIELVQYVTQHLPHLPIAVISAYGSMDVAIDALKAGAFDFVSKPIDQARLKQLVEHALQVHESPAATAQAVAPQLSDQSLIGESAIMQQLRAMLSKLARSQAPVYISGESGTGKEVVARLIHQLGPRSSQPFIPVNCGAIPAELMESEFFGHKKGSFTGATEDKPGLFQSAHGGTLFLDEVADLPLGMQVKLLRAIQEKKIRPIGGQTEIPVDIRILSATHKDLKKMVHDGLFRQDLFYRINVIEIALPPLRERGDDVLLLADIFLQRICTEWQIPVPVLSPAAKERLKQYPFLGNVRELHNILERALTLCDASVIEPEHLQLEGSSQPGLKSEHSGPHALSASINLQALRAPVTMQHSIPAEGLEAHLQQVEKQIILNALEQNQWNRTATARKLGMSFRSLRYRLKKLGVCDEDDLPDEYEKIPL